MTSGFSGDFAIFLASGMALLAGLAFFLTAIGKRNLFSLGIRAYYLQITFVTAALVYLWYLFFRHDFSIEYVYEYSSSDLPFFYLLSALWAGQEGTYLLWLFFSSIFGLIILRKGQQYRIWGMVFYSLVNLFLLVMLLTLSPFRPLGFSVPEGAGLNPLLQDPWMVVHPPVVFVAFAMAAVPFAIVMAAMIKKDYSDWLALSFPYVAITSLALAIANVLGGYWAYKTLGWGGYWAWDPVENTSLIPWLISLGLIHGMLIEKRSGALRRSNLLLTAFVFLLVIYGTFLTRSGVLGDFSVHSFVDLGANAVLISFVAFYLIIILTVFLFSRSPDIAGKPLNYNVYSRDFVLFLAMVLLFAFGIIVLFWSSLPFITKYLSSAPSAAEPSTYNAFAFPFAIIISLFLTVSPFITTTGQGIENLKIRVLLSLIAASAAAILLLILNLTNLTIAFTVSIYIFVILIYLGIDGLTWKILLSIASGIIGLIVSLLLGVRNVEYLFFIGAAIAAAGANTIAIMQLVPKHIDRTGGQLCHFGFGIMLVGILASSAFVSNEQLILPRGQSQSAYRYDVTYHGLTGTMMDKDNEILLTLDGDGRQVDARPQFFYSHRLDGIMKRPHIEKKLLYDLYLSPQDIQKISDSRGLVIKKGETKIVGDFTITFIDYDLRSHPASPAATFSVAIKLEVEHEGKKETVTPMLVAGPAVASGKIADPVKLFRNSDYEIKVEHMYVYNKSVALSIPGLIDLGPPDRLILDISIKPGINLLWLGTIIIFIGMTISIYRRLSE